MPPEDPVTRDGGADRDGVAAERREFGAGGKTTLGVLDTVSVPEPFAPIFLRAQQHVAGYFAEREENPRRSTILISGERNILVRAASMSVEFFDLVMSLYKERGVAEARSVASNLLFDVAHAIGRADARTFHARMQVTDPVEKLSAGPIHFSYSGWAFVEILTHWVCILRDVSDRKAHLAALEHQALHDVLTDLPNRVLLLDRLDQAILSAARNDDSLALIIMDLDRFKEANDTFGHHIGDQVLMQVGPRLRNQVRTTDTVARPGWDEFAILLPTVGGVEDAVSMGKKLVRVAAARRLK